MADLNLRVKVLTEGTNKLRSLGGSLGGIARFGATAVAGLTAAGVAGGAVLANMARGAEETEAKLESVFKGSGAAAFTSIPKLEAHAQALAAATTFDDDSIKEGQAALLSFGNITGEAFTDATEAATDLAAFMETDVPSAAKQLGRALAVPEAAAGRLARQGIVLTEVQQEQIDKFVEAGDTAAAQGVILDALGEKFGTVAEDIASTDSGKITNAWKQISEAGESIGMLLLPVFAMVAQAVKGFADFLLANMPTIQAVVQTVIGGITSLFQGAGGAVGGLNVIFNGLVEWVKANLPTIMSVAQQVFGAVANVIKVVGPIVLTLAQVILPILGAAASVLFKVMDVAFKGIGGAFEALGNVFTAVGSVISGVVSGVVGAFKAIYNAFASFWNSIDIDFPRIEVPFFGVIGGFSIGLPDIPMLAEGGIVKRPTLAVLGEKGPEAVVPLGASRTAATVNNFAFSIQSPIPDERGIVALVERSQRLAGAWD